MLHLGFNVAIERKKERNVFLLYSNLRIHSIFGIVEQKKIIRNYFVSAQDHRGPQDGALTLILILTQAPG